MVRHLLFGSARFPHLLRAGVHAVCCYPGDRAEPRRTDRGKGTTSAPSDAGAHSHRCQVIRAAHSRQHSHFHRQQILSA